MLNRATGRAAVERITKIEQAMISSRSVIPISEESRLRMESLFDIGL
jgi:hypothetical protein